MVLFTFTILLLIVTMGLSCSLKNMGQQNKGGLILIVGLKAPTTEFASFLFCFVFPLFWCQKIIASKSSLDPCTFTPLLSDSFDLSTYTQRLLLMCLSVIFVYLHSKAVVDVFKCYICLLTHKRCCWCV